MNFPADKILTSHLHGLLNSPTDFAILSLDRDGGLVLWNAGAATLFDLDPEMAGAEISSLLDGNPSALRIHMAEALDSGRASLTGWYRSTTHKRFWGEGTLSPIYDEAGVHVGYLKIIRDASGRQQAEQDVLQALHTDDLTGLSNRAFFHTRLQEMLGAIHRHQHIFILHLLDLDFFKGVNDTLGHQAGDELLRQVGERLRKVCRDTDLIARLGGDEFAIIQVDAASPADGSLLAEKVIHALAQPFVLGESEASISASIGLAVAPQDGRIADELLRKADGALYRAKHSGRSAYSYFTRALDLETQNRHRDIGALREAVRDQMFFLVYQPKVASSTDHPLVGMEALLRCSHPQLARRPIRELIRLAAECGHIHQLSEWIIVKACKQARFWFDQGHAGFNTCVNLCARELACASTLDTVDRALHMTGLRADDLHVELTEQELFESKSVGMKVLHGLSERGVAIALDDFGTGYASLSYLTNLPVDLIKLDVSLTRRLPHDEQTRKVVHAVIDLAHALELDVVAEGMEQKEQLLAMHQMQCDALQGYYISRPLVAAQMTRWMKERRARPD